MIFFWGCEYVGADEKIQVELIGSSSELWHDTIDKVIKSPLWSTRDAYDSAHILMVTLHFSFVANDKNAIRSFENLFARFSTQELAFGQLNQVHWLYLTSRYLALKCQFGYPFNSADRYLIHRLSSYIYTKWLYLPSFQWGRYPFVGTKARLDFILSPQDISYPSYYKAVTDFELFIFAIAADLKFILQKKDIELGKENTQTIKEVVNYAFKILMVRGVFTSDDGWLFQQGIWTDHPDYKYSGHLLISPSLKPKKQRNIAEDSSHSHRWPLWLRSLSLSEESGKYSELINKIYMALSFQFKNHVVVIDDEAGYLKLNNYMDGSNGIYRYKYQTIGKNKQSGYKSYALSGILGESWYPFLDNVDLIFRTYALSYPLPEDAIKLYVGPNTTRIRNPLYQWPAFFTNGFAKLIAMHAWYVSKNYKIKQLSNISH
jgi:hypothetical protein